MVWTIEYTNTSRKQLRRLDHPAADRILKFLSERVANHPNPYALGEALSGEWSGLLRYRVGDYRIICKIQAQEMIVAVLKVGHRSDVYD